MPSPSFSIHGLIRHAATGQVLPGLRVEAWDKDLLFDDLLGQALSDSEGRFTIAFDAGFFSEMFLDKKPDLYFKIFAGTRLLRSTERDVIWNAGEPSAGVILELADAPAETGEGHKPAAPSRKVYGTVRDEYGELMSGVSVTVLDRDLRTEQVLGRVSAVQARYEVPYTSAQFRRSEKGAADIVVKLYDGKGSLLHTTPVHFNAPDLLEVNISLGKNATAGPSLWEKISTDLQPLLDGLSPLELREDEQHQDITFLAGESGYNAELIMQWAVSHHLAEKMRREDLHLGVPQFFAFLHAGQPPLIHEALMRELGSADSMELVKEKVAGALGAMLPELQQATLEAAVDKAVIPATAAKSQAQSLQALGELRLRNVAGQTANGGGKGTVGQLLALTGGSAGSRDSFLTAYAAHTGTTASFWSSLAEENVMETETLRDVKLNFQLGALTRNYIPIVGALNQLFRKNKVSAKRDLASYTQEQWLDLISSKGADGMPVGVPDNMDGKTEQERRLQYAAVLEQSFERAYPTASLAARLGRDAGSRLGAGADIAAFLKQNPHFYLDRHNLDQYIAQNPGALNGLGNGTAAVSELKTVQRLFKLNASYASVSALLDAGLTSAQQIYFAGREQLARRLGQSGLNQLEVKQLYNRAENSYALAIALFGNYNGGINRLTP